MMTMKRVALGFGLWIAGLLAVSGQTIVPEEHRLVRSDREDGRMASTYGVAHALLEHTRPALAFDPGFTVDEMRAWQHQVSTAMAALMKHPATEGQPAPRMLWSEQREGYVEQKWEFYPLAECVATFLVLIPDSLAGPVPAVMCIPGSGVAKETVSGDLPVSRERNAFGRNIARRGYVAVVVDNACAGEQADVEVYGRVGYDYTTSSRLLLELGWSWLGYTSFLDKLVLDWMKEQPFIRADRLVVCGFSLGTEPLMVLGAMDSTIYAFAYNDFLCNTQERALVTTVPDTLGRRSFPNSIRHLIPGWWRFFNFPDVVASLAPRRLILTEGGLDRDFRLVRRAYEIAGCPENVELHHYALYADEADRRDVEHLDEGLTMNEFLRAANVDAANHYFKEEWILPWLDRVLAE